MLSTKEAFLLILSIFRIIIETRCIQFNVLNTGNVYQFSSDENSGENGESLGTVTCTEAGGAALTGPVEYNILEPDSVPFELNDSTGDLRLRNGEVLDYEQSQLHTFNISCFYVNNTNTRATATVRFSVFPLNEFEPELSDSSLTVTISEASPAETILVSRDSSGLIRYTVSDADDGYDGEITFLSAESNPPGFELNQSSGALSLQQPLDLDSGEAGLLRITYTVIVCDGDRPREECASLDVSILVRSANDNPPVFEQDVYTLTLSEDTPAGTSLITVVCTDADRHGVGEFSGITVEPPSAPVYIPDQRNGSVILKESLDFELTSSVNVTLVCNDSGSLQTNAFLEIKILAINDNSPEFTEAEYRFSVDRLSFTGEEIGQVEATDADKIVGNDVTYVLLDSGANDKFILKSDGTIILNSFVFLAEGSNFELVVQASDQNFTTTAKVSVTVTGFLSLLEIVIIAIVVLLLGLILILILSCICCFRSKKRSKKIRLDQLPEDHSCLPNAPESPYIEMASHTSQEALRYRANSLNRDTSLVIIPYPENDPMRYVELPAHWKASNIIINELEHTPHPQRAEDIYSEVSQRVEESNYVELSNPQLEQAVASHRTLPIVPEPIPEESSDCESVYDFYTTVPPMDLAVSCPSLPSMKSRSTRRVERIHQDLDWGTIPESQLKKSRSIAGKLRRK